MNRVFSIIMFCLLSGFGAAEESTRFDLANRQAAAGEYAHAAGIYQEILAADGPNAAVLFNLGNCEQRLGRFGPAILAYERARLLTPRDPDLLANLALARKAAAVFEEPGRFPRLDGFFGFASLDEWSWLVAGSALLLGGLAVLRGGLRSRSRGVLQASRAAAGLAAVFILTGAAALYLRRDERNRGVVLSVNSVVRLSPFETADALGTTGPGRIVHVLGTNGGFHFVQVPGTGLRGWMSDRDVDVIHAEMKKGPSGEPEGP